MKKNQDIKLTPKILGFLILILIFIILPNLILVVFLRLGVFNTNDNARYFLFITLSGYIGGILYASRKNKIEIPYMENNNILNLGFINDALSGVVGAYLIFFIFPFDYEVVNDKSNSFITVTNEIKVIGTGLVGGYAGRGLIKKIQDSWAINDIKDEIKDQTGKLKEEIRSRDAIQSRRDNIIYLLTHQFDLSRGLTKKEKDELKENLLETVKTQDVTPRIKAFFEAKDIRQDAALKLIELLDKNSNQKLTIEKKTLGESEFLEDIHQKKENIKILRDIKLKINTTIFVFECLIECDRSENKDNDLKYYKNFAQLAFALKDKMYAANEIDNVNNWKQVKDYLEKAIAIRDRQNKETKTEWNLLFNDGIYELNKAICLIEIDRIKNVEHDLISPSDHEAQKEILECINKAYESHIKKHEIQKIDLIFPINIWAKNNIKAIREYLPKIEWINSEWINSE